MGRQRSPDHEVNRERILANAVRAFGEVGYPSATMAQLAQACGTSKAGLYHYYASKESLLFDALDQYTRRLVALAGEVFERKLPPHEQIGELVRVFVDEYRHSRDYHVALLNDVKFLAERQRDTIRAQERAVVQRFRDALTAAFPERMRSETAMPTTMALLGMINFTFAWLRPDGPLTHREFADLVIRLWEHGLSGPAPVRDGASRRVTRRRPTAAPATIPPTIRSAAPAAIPTTTPHTHMSKQFASKADLTEKQTSFIKLSDHAYAYTAEGDPNSGVIIGDNACMVIDTTATPAMAQSLIARIREVTDKPIKYVVLSHYHAVRVLGASAYFAEGAQEIIASRGTWDLIVERGEADMKSEIERFPRLFAGVETVPGLTWPTIVFERELTLHLGKLEVRLMHLGPGHTKGDTIAWLPAEKICFSGDLVEYNAGVYTGDAHLTEWPDTLAKLAALGPQKLVPGRGPAMETPADCLTAIDYTRRWVTDLFGTARAGVQAGKNLKEVFADTRKVMDPVFGKVFIYEHCLPFDVSRAYDEASGIRHPRIWTAQRDLEMWQSLQD